MTANVHTSFREHGYTILRGLYTDAELDAMQAELERCSAAGGRRAAGSVRHRDPRRSRRGDRRRAVRALRVRGHPVSRRPRAAVLHPAIVDAVQQPARSRRWLLEDDRFGVVYQDARPGAGRATRVSAGTPTRNRGPTLDWWPSVAFTIHLDATSPQNGFLRVVPGSHRGGTEGMPPGFEQVRGRGRRVLRSRRRAVAPLRPLAQRRARDRRRRRAGSGATSAAAGTAAAARRPSTASTTSSRTPAAKVTTPSPEHRGRRCDREYRQGM